VVELKHCPFCGGKATRSHGGEDAKAYFGTGCADQRCPAHLFALLHRSQVEADAAWNRRAEGLLTVGTLVSAPTCGGNAAGAFRVTAIEEEAAGRVRVRGRDTCWFLVSDVHIVEGAPVLRVLDESDSFCPKCGHNRDKSSVSSINHGTHQSCQVCAAEWREVAYGVLVAGQQVYAPAGIDGAAPGGRERK
jgi:hypothetical protein